MNAGAWYDPVITEEELKITKPPHGHSPGRVSNTGGEKADGTAP